MQKIKDSKDGQQKSLTTVFPNVFYYTPIVDLKKNSFIGNQKSYKIEFWITFFFVSKF